MTDFQSYLTPDVYVSEAESPIISTPIGTAPPTVAVVGTTRGFERNSEVLQLFESTETQLSRRGIDAATIEVRDRFTGTTYEEGVHYSTSVEGDGTDSTTTISIGIGGEDHQIADGDFVTVSYQYTDENYFNIVRTSDFEDIKDKFGTVFNSEGDIQSSLTFGSQLVFINGAPEVVAVPVADSGDSPWEDAFSRLSEVYNIDIVIPLSGDTSVHQNAFLHVQNMVANNRFRRLFVGYDGTVESVGVNHYTAQASGYSNPRVSVFGPSRFEIYNSVNNENINIGGQYFAAACGGRIAAQPIQEPLTRKVVSGFNRISEHLSENQMLTMQRNGVVVGWQKRNGALIVRHGLTTDMRNDYVREISVHSIRDRLQEMIYDGLDRQGLIGGYITSSTPQRVKGAVVGVLDYASEIDLIFDYTSVKWRIPQTRPTVVQVRAMYKPTMPLNYIDMQFAIDVESGDMEWQQMAT